MARWQVVPLASTSIASLHRATKQNRMATGTGFGALMILTLATIVVCLGIGRVALSPGRLLAVLFSNMGLVDPVDLFKRAIVLNACLRRTLLAALSDASLAVAGAALLGRAFLTIVDTLCRSAT
jgi:ABC-type Fe3+-siderophore transport system permease subunit